MNLNASTFVKRRSNVVAITNVRIKHIIWYIIECYHLLKLDSPVYSKDWIRKNTTHKPEDFLKMELIEKYLIPNKHILNSKTSFLENICFNYEVQKRYIDSNDSREKVDKIDIYISKLGLASEWMDFEENVYFSIECKRILFLSDTKAYISDVQKFTQRNHISTRLPFEGMLGFIENKNLKCVSVLSEVNNILRTSTSISTTSFLIPISIHSNFNDSFFSVHKKNFGSKVEFSIYHLFFDYTNLVSN
ncbi:hypothetical protein [Fibrella aquatica]|uniref:hypothetical protein n=1 Tax=Fibrella aquatica TaxID=3242487 RepID=UPI00351FF0FC